MRKGSLQNGTMLLLFQVMKDQFSFLKG